jgi:integrase
MTKTCTKCREEKTLDLFYRDKNRVDGLGLWCKSCQRDYYTARVKGDPDYFLKYQRLSRNEKRARTLAIRTNSGRTDCGEKHPACLEFHHLDASTKDASAVLSQLQTTPRTLTLEKLAEADRMGELRGSSILTTLALRENLWEAMDKQIPKMGRSKETRKRYQVTRDAFETKAAKYLPKGAQVNGLVLVDWEGLRDTWGNSASDWMHLRRFISAFLSRQLGSSFHPFRIAVVTNIPIAQEVERVPDITPEVFWQIIEKCPEHARPAYVTLVLTGMRRGEYLRATKEHLRPAILGIQIPGTKTRGSLSTVYVEESLWPWIESGIPSPLRYKRLRETWRDACAKIGITGIHLHDLRHCTAQWATNEGVPQVKVQDAMRHASPAMTNKYSRQQSKGEVAQAMSRALKRKA